VAPASLPRNSDVIVVGAPPAAGQLASLARSLPVPVPDSIGSLEQVNASDGDLRLLWVGGSRDNLASAARALTAQVEGPAVTVDASGHITELPAPSPAATVVNSGLPKLLPVLAALLLAFTLGLQLLRPRARGET
jgi:hypothetical protein